MTGPRAYDPVMARFLQGDPLAGSELETSPSIYAKANPASRVDPGGYQPVPPHALQPLPPGNYPDAIQNGTRMFVGGYYASITEITPGSLQVSVWNDTSLNSYAYHALPSHPRMPGQTMRYGTAEQFFYWNVPLNTASLQPGGQAGQTPVSPTTPSAPPSTRQGAENIKPPEWYPAMGTQPVPTE
jgi:hypothetical protein